MKSFRKSYFPNSQHDWAKASESRLNDPVEDKSVRLGNNVNRWSSALSLLITIFRRRVAIALNELDQRFEDLLDVVEPNCRSQKQIMRNIEIKYFLCFPKVVTVASKYLLVANRHLLLKDYGENHNILSRRHTLILFFRTFSPYDQPKIH